MVNEQATSAAVAQAREAKAERLFQALLGKLANITVPQLWENVRDRDVSAFHEMLRNLCVSCYDAGFDDGFAEGEAVANEPDRNEGFE